MVMNAFDTNFDTENEFYAVNTIGAVAGSLIAGFVLIPLFGLDHNEYRGPALYR